MTIVPGKKLSLIAGLLFWMLMIAVAIQDYVNSKGTQYWEPVLWESSSAIACTVLLLIQRHYTRAYDHLLATPGRWFAVQLLWLPIICTAFVPLAFSMRHTVYAIVGQTYQHKTWLWTFFYESVKVSVFFGIFSVVLFGVLSYQSLLEERQRSEQARELIRQAQLQRLTQQMQPHFLFNALNTISALMQTDVDKADRTLMQLAQVLRTTLDLGEQQTATLATELTLIRAYSHLMAERFSDRVDISWHTDDSINTCPVPVMSMQPLLENIFKHTVEQRRQATRISIATLRDGADIVLRLEDDQGTLVATGSAGIGLANLRQRLQVLHGDAASLTLTQLTPAGVRADLRLPCAC